MLSEGAKNEKIAFSFDYIFFKRFLKLLSWIFPGCCSIQLLLCVFLLCIGLLEQVVIFQIGNVASKYYKVFGDNDLEGFKKETCFALLYIIAQAFIKSTKNFVAAILYIKWRGTITIKIHKEYFKDYLYYKMNVCESTDNPDQRITQDVDRLCYYLSQILVPVIISPFTIAYYLYHCAKTTGYLGPVGVLVFFTVGTIFNKLLMSPVVDYVFKRKKLEGDFRFKHMQIRVNAESAAFYKAGAVERSKTDDHLIKLLSVQQKLAIREYGLHFSVNLFDYLGSILSYVLLAFPIFNGKFSDVSTAELSSVISSNSFVIIYLINCFTSLIDLAVNVSGMAGNAHRVGELIEVLGRLKAEQHPSYEFLSTEDSSECQSLTEMSLLPLSSDAGDGTFHRSIQDSWRAFILNDVSYSPPKSHSMLCRNLSFQLESGVNTLITGDSGCGKSSLLRVISGLWPSVTGTITRNIPFECKHLLFLPQKPYFTNGSLRQQIMYPVLNNEMRAVAGDDDKIQRHLEYVGLENLLDRVNGLDMEVDWNWYDELSPGEMQRLSFVRLFYHHPRFAVLDEATSQIGLDAEEKIYRLCGQLGITLLSVGHRTSLRKYHQVEIVLDGKGGWKIEPIRDNIITSSDC